MINQKVFLAGHNGLVGSSILKKLKEKGYKKIITKNKNQLNLLEYNKVSNFLKKTINYSVEKTLKVVRKIR